MRKLKLQTQMTVSGYIGGPNGELDWMTWVWDEDLKNYVREIHKSIDTIFLGRKMSEGFMPHWTDMAKNQPEHEEYEFAKIMVAAHKVIFTKTLDKTEWENTSLAKGDIVEEVNKLKAQKGGDIIVYGGSNFVSNLIKHNLIDEYHLLVNPVAISKGLAIFGEIDGKMDLQLVKAAGFQSGIVDLFYQPKK